MLTPLNKQSEVARVNSAKIFYPNPIPVMHEITFLVEAPAGSHISIQAVNPLDRSTVMILRGIANQNHECPMWGYIPTWKLHELQLIVTVNDVKKCMTVPVDHTTRASD